MNPSYVEGADFKVIADHEIVCAGRKLRVREYVLAANPDQRPTSESFLFTVVYRWAMAGAPLDELFHLGVWFRVTATWSLRHDRQIASC